MIRRTDWSSLRKLAQQCRWLARGASTREVSRTLSQMAEDYDRQAEKARARDARAEAPGAVPNR